MCAVDALRRAARLDRDDSCTQTRTGALRARRDRRAAAHLPRANTRVADRAPIAHTMRERQPSRVQRAGSCGAVHACTAARRPQHSQAQVQAQLCSCTHHAVTRLAAAEVHEKACNCADARRCARAVNAAGHPNSCVICARITNVTGACGDTRCASYAADSYLVDSSLDTARRVQTSARCRVS